jgi:hypothetical protein
MNSTDGSGAECEKCGVELVGAAADYPYCGPCGDNQRDKVHRPDDEYGTPDSPNFAHEKGDCFTINGGRAWFVTGRYWKYDLARTDYFYPVRKYHQHYALGRVEALGGTDQLVSEVDLEQHYEHISSERAEEIDL